jgi:NAD(P)-dependent dehydrogenase (short-subunit alcohol dehydrogenase family)
MKKFPNKRVVITGAGSGLGRSLALEFAKLGWKILVADIHMERANESVKLIEQAGGNGLEVQCDVTQWDQVKNLADTAVSNWGGADIIVNNAGVPAVGFVQDIPLEDWRWIMDINLMGVIHGCKAFIPLFKKQGGGHIVNTASAAGFCSLAEMGPYNVTKAGVISLSETLKMELAYQNIGITVVCPTFFKTNLMDQFRCTDKRQVEMANGFFRLSLGTAEGVSRHIIRCIRRNRLYTVTQPDAKMYWFLKRHTPNFYFKMLSFVYGRGILDKVLGVK